ncbi:hypothetical protein PQR71_41945 [Paraburkholderia fungorum]
MKDSRIYFLLAAIYFAPHLSPAVAIGSGAYLTACALYAMWREA